MPVLKPGWIAFAFLPIAAVAAPAIAAGASLPQAYAACVIFELVFRMVSYAIGDPLTIGELVAEHGGWRRVAPVEAMVTLVWPLAMFSRLALGLGLWRVD